MIFRKKKQLSVAETLRKAFPNIYIVENAPMSEYTTFRCGGRAAALAEPRSAAELAALLAHLADPAAPPHLVLGNGSNTLFADGLYPGVVIKMGAAFAGCSVEKDLVRAGGGALLAAVAKEACRQGLCGLEFATGIPGSVGGGVFMNAGAYGSDIAAVLKSATVMSPDGAVRECPAEELALSYRHSSLMNSGDIVLEATFLLKAADQEEIEALVRDLTQRRTSKQPLQYPSAGSFFKRPEGHFAGALIEQAGLKGLQLGGAQVSPLHAGFIVNTGDATATDVIDLMKVVQETVLHSSGVLLEPEVRIIGL